MTNIFEIRQWNPIIIKNMAPIPMIYVIPNEELLKLLNYKHRIFVKIFNSNSLYDNLIIEAQLSPSELTPNYRPNFQQQTGYISLILLTQWNGYPDSLGNIQILDMEIMLESLDDDADTIQESFLTTNNYYSTSIITTIIIVSLLLILTISLKKK